MDTQAMAVIFFLQQAAPSKTCDKKGIVYYDNEGHRVYDPKARRWSNPYKRIIKKFKKNKEQWFDYKIGKHQYHNKCCVLKSVFATIETNSSERYQLPKGH